MLLHLAAVLAERPVLPVVCRVVFYSGYKSRETHRAVRVAGRELKVLEGLDRRWVQDVRCKTVAEVLACRLKKAGKGHGDFLRPLVEHHTLWQVMN